MPRLKVAKPRDSVRDLVEKRDDGRWYWIDKPEYKQNKRNYEQALGFNGRERPNIQVDGVRYGAARLIYWLETGDFPEIVDHIDQNPYNNLGSNLRAADHRNNKINSKKNGYNVSKVITKSGFRYKTDIKIADKEGNQTTFYIGRYKDELTALYAAWKIRDLLYPGFAPLPEKLKEMGFK